MGRARGSVFGVLPRLVPCLVVEVFVVAGRPRSVASHGSRAAVDMARGGGVTNDTPTLCRRATTTKAAVAVSLSRRDDTRWRSTAACPFRRCPSSAFAGAGSRATKHTPSASRRRCLQRSCRLLHFSHFYHVHHPAGQPGQLPPQRGLGASETGTSQARCLVMHAWSDSIGSRKQGTPRASHRAPLASSFYFSCSQNTILSSFPSPLANPLSRPLTSRQLPNTTTSIIAMSRALKIGGAAAAVGAGYYFYQAGGDPKAAQKRFEGMHRSMMPCYEANADQRAQQPTPPSFSTLRRTTLPPKAPKSARTPRSSAPTLARRSTGSLLRPAMEPTRSTRSSRSTGQGRRRTSTSRSARPVLS